MKFSRYRLFFMILSAVLAVSLYGYTYGVKGGFANSITFNGGIRLTIVLPPGLNKDLLEKKAREVGFEDAQVRLSNLRANQYDLELGPDIRDRIAAEIKKKEAAYDKAAAALKAEGKEPPPREELSVAGEIEKVLIAGMPEIGEENVVSRETISASYGSDLGKIALMSFIWTILIIGLYLSFRFDFPYALGASLALIHDVVMSVGFIGVMGIEPSIPVVAAVLTIVGYSINDTIVIFDRIRENMEESASMAIRETMDTAITQTLSRTIITSLLTLIAVMALLLGGADTLVDFAWVLLFGIVVGTYSSIFIASHFVQYYQEIVMRKRSR